MSLAPLRRRAAGAYSATPMTTTRYHIGAKSLRSTITAYAKRFDLLEVPSSGDKDATVPTLPTMRRWRKAVAPPFNFTVVAGQALARLKPGDALDRDLAAALAAADALEARCLLLPTPSEVTPSPVWRERLERVIGRLAREATHIIWEPRGVWETDDAAVAARKWRIVLAVDAARDPVPDGPVAYARLRALGETRSFGPAALERVVDAIGARRDAYVILDTDTALGEAKKLRQILQAGARDGGGGMGRVMRPRGATVKVRDDEQE
jgi:uncharacterized protein YecE (DUF72 family)